MLKRDAVARVVLNNLYKHTELQTNFSANMLALVDGVPRTLHARPVHQQLGGPPDRRHPAAHRATACAEAEERAHILRGLRQGAGHARRGDRPDPARPEVEDARDGLIELLEIDELQANAILDMQLRRLAALERQKIIDQLAEIELEIADLRDILANVPSASDRSSPTSSPRSSRSTATSAVPRSSRPTATSRWRT